MVNIAIRIVNSLKAAAPIFAALVLGAALASAVTAQEKRTKVKPEAKSEEHRPANVRLAMPMMNAERGM